MKLGLDHVGILTHNVEVFEKFWCKVIGYKQAEKDGVPYESHMPKEMCFFLFGVEEQFLIRRYNHPVIKTDIEMHMFKNRLTTYNFDVCRNPSHFGHKGFNHICLHTGGKNSRQEFLATLDKVKKIVYDNPQGWQNIFILDYENNFVELRESF